MLPEWTTKIIRRCLVGPEQDFSFRAAQDVNPGPVQKTGLYIHIPFCKNLCPYCPYNKIRYQKRLVEPYLNALLEEVELYYSRIGRAEISSIYIGGGTPTNLTDELGIVLNRVRERFHVTGDICVETNPEDLDREKVDKLLQYGVNLLSLGGQSFDDRFLKLLGREYTAAVLERSLELALNAGFKSVNLDLMFALPGQTVREVEQDLARAVRSGVNQVTTYPLFSFPYTTVGRYRKLKKVKMPNLAARRKMYRTIHNFFLEHGFRRVSVWGFLRGEAPRYSSVTRECYIGLGAGAGSHVPGVFYLNTFSVEEYIKSCLSGRLPVALSMDFTGMMTLYYWLYWRLYDTRIPKRQLFELFGEGNRELKLLLRLLYGLKMAADEGDQIVLNERGAFWLHLLQNYFALPYINKVWSAARETAYPERIKL